MQNSSQQAFPIILRDDAEVERLIEAEVARRAESASWLWRFRLICLETILFGALVLAGGLALGQPRLMVLRATVLVAASCFASGLILLGLSAWTGRLLTRFRAWRAR
jgi:hypothetical protein